MNAEFAEEAYDRVRRLLEEADCAQGVQVLAGTSATALLKLQYQNSTTRTLLEPCQNSTTRTLVEPGLTHPPGARH